MLKTELLPELASNYTEDVTSAKTQCFSFSYQTPLRHPLAEAERSPLIPDDYNAIIWADDVPLLPHWPACIVMISL